MLARAQAVREVGLMDEVTLVGGEETEWHRRFWSAGWRIVFLPDAAIVHYGSQTLRVVPGLEVEYLKGAVHYFSKHRPRAVVVALCVFALPLVATQWLMATTLGRGEEKAAKGASLRVLLGDSGAGP